MNKFPDSFNRAELGKISAAAQTARATETETAARNTASLWRDDIAAIVTKAAHAGLTHAAFLLGHDRVFDLSTHNAEADTDTLCAALKRDHVLFNGVHDETADEMALCTIGDELLERFREVEGVYVKSDGTGQIYSVLPSSTTCIMRLQNIARHFGRACVIRLTDVPTKQL